MTFSFLYRRYKTFCLFSEKKPLSLSSHHSLRYVSNFRHFRILSSQFRKGQCGIAHYTYSPPFLFKSPVGLAVKPNSGFALVFVRFLFKCIFFPLTFFFFFKEAPAKGEPPSIGLRDTKFTQGWGRGWGSTAKIGLLSQF